MDSSSMNITSAGRAVLAKAIAGKNLHFTRAMTGDGFLPKDKTPYALENLISPRQTLEIQSISTTGIGTCEIVVEMTNKNLSSGYFVREYGLFALEPDTKREILYAYANKGDYASYMEGSSSFGAGADLINYALSIVTVVDQSPNITATINNNNTYVTATKLDAKFTNLYAEGVTPAGFWTFSPSDDNRLRPLSLDEVKRTILGTASIEALNARVKRLEDNLGQVLLSQEMASLFPQATNYIIEDFENVNQVDLFSCKVNSIITGDDSLDCDPISGIIPKSNYIISDGITSEKVTVSSVNIENGIQRVILEAPIKNTYALEYCRMFRSSAVIAGKTAQAPGTTLSLKWSPAAVWRGKSSQDTITTELNFNAENSYIFTLTGNATVSNSGFLTLGA